MLLPEDIDAFVSASAPEHDPIQAEMAEEAAERGFPIIGRVAGSYLQGMAAARSAEAVFEFGSGFGYSATWFLKGMSPSGEIVLTERDPDNVNQAEAYLRRAGHADRATVEQGDALEIVDSYEGPFDVVLLDHDKEHYLDGFERVEEKVKPGGVVITDNIMRGPVSYEEILEYVTSGEGMPDDRTAAGLVSYLRGVSDRDDFHTFVLPIGNGLAVSTRLDG